MSRMKFHDEAEVIVVGSGLAGMTAAIQAADSGAKVIVLEKEDKTGGNSAKATSGINGWGTETQAKHGVADEERLFERDTFKSGKGGQVSFSLVRTLSTQSANAIHWLVHRFGIPLTVLSQLGGHSAKRTHRAPPKEDGTPVPIGYLITKTLREVILNEYAQKIEIRTKCRVTQLLHGERDGYRFVHGVQYEKDGANKSLSADAVILATGGFGFDRSSNGYMSKFRPDLLKFPTTNGDCATGDGLTMCEQVNANFLDLKQVQLHPTGFIDPNNPGNPTKFLAPEAIRGSGAILLNHEGKRFVNELDLRSVVSSAIIQSCKQKAGNSPYAWCILSPKGAELFGEPMLKFYRDRQQLFSEVTSPKELSELIGCRETTLIQTFEAYSHATDSGICEQTGKTVFPSPVTANEAKYLVARVTPSIHYCMGGIEINAAGEVLEKPSSDDTFNREQRHIRGLFAAGEVTGGVHGKNRLGGNSLLECVVFGRIAGERAAVINQKIDTALKLDEYVPLVLREVKNTDKIYGRNTKELVFNLNGALQTSGTKVGQFLSIQGVLDGETLTGYFSPITRPEDEGSLGILYRTDSKGGPIVNLLEHIRPGSAVHVKAMGGLRLDFTEKGIFWEGREIRQFGLLAGGTGVAPMLQIILAFFNYLQHHKRHPEYKSGLNLVYAAETEADLAFMSVFEELQEKYTDHFRFYPVLNNPPLGWTEGVGFVTPSIIREKLFYPPSEDQLIVMCGPPIFEKIMKGHLKSLGFKTHLYYGYS